ncbi:MAG: hypothetical protein OXF88_13850, partial [Rhodobacteraceae bacterium]|nr:hypothetical protein [Paracoccaceae bacterium]
PWKHREPGESVRVHEDGPGRHRPAPECGDPLMLAVGTGVRRLRQPPDPSRVHRIMTFPR